MIAVWSGPDWRTTRLTAARVHMALDEIAEFTQWQPGEAAGELAARLEAVSALATDLDRQMRPLLEEAGGLMLGSLGSNAPLIALRREAAALAADAAAAAEATSSGSAASDLAALAAALAAVGPRLAALRDLIGAVDQ